MQVSVSVSVFVSVSVSVSLIFLLPHPQVYLHCRLVAWDPSDLSGSNKACQYDRKNSRYNN